MGDLTELRGRVAAGEATTMAFDDAFAGFPDTFIPDRAEQCYFGSLDAAKALHEALLPGWEVNASMSPCQGGWETAINLWNGRMAPDSCEVIILDHEADTPARAWLLAILDALIAKDTDDAEHS